MLNKYFSNTVIHLALTLIFFLSCLENICSQDIESISVKNLREHMDSIASDATEGRLTGTNGYKIAANYAAKKFKEAGLKPGFNNENGNKSFMQPVPFIRKNYTSSSLTIRKNEQEKRFYHSAGDFVIYNSGIANEEVEISSPAFIGYGICETEMGWDDYKGLDIKDKWVIVIDGLPPIDSHPSFSDSLRRIYTDRKTRNSLRYKALLKHKVAGLIILPNEKEINNWSNKALRSYRYNYIRYSEDNLKEIEKTERNVPVMLIGPEIFNELFSGHSFDPPANKERFHSYILDNTKLSVDINCKKERINCYNIIGVIPGTDSILKKEYITVGAHLDHLGKIREDVYNGANDNASSCVIILEAAKAIALNPPKRSVLFILYTGEELIDLVGSKHFLKHPSIPIEQISLNINIEQIGSKNRNYNGIWGIGESQFNSVFSTVNRSFQETNFKYDELNEEFKNELKGQVDSWSYIEKGIPAVMLSSGGFPSYHKSTDKINLIDFDHLFVASNFLYSFIIKLGNK